MLVWRAARRGVGATAVGLAAVLGGAAANLLDRASDGTVTDYLHTGWWPTFNLADIAIVTGASLLLLAEIRRERPMPPTVAIAHLPEQGGPAELERHQ